jgi:hypothetical protein
MSDAKAVQVHGGKGLSSDGQFPRTKEPIGGYCLIDCKGLDRTTASRRTGLCRARLAGAPLGIVRTSTMSGTTAPPIRVASIRPKFAPDVPWFLGQTEQSRW